MSAKVEFDIEELRLGLKLGYRFLLARVGEDGKWLSSYYMSRMDCSAEMKSDRESSGRYDITYIVLEVRALIDPGEIYTGFER